MAMKDLEAVRWHARASISRYGNYKNYCSKFINLYAVIQQVYKFIFPTPPERPAVLHLLNAPDTKIETLGASQAALSYYMRSIFSNTKKLQEAR